MSLHGKIIRYSYWCCMNEWNCTIPDSLCIFHTSNCFKCPAATTINITIRAMGAIHFGSQNARIFRYCCTSSISGNGWIITDKHIQSPQI
ncbi:MAG: hypothetical protein GF383_12085 [Candidatus Lokiarchaeota archaeon]|nr:hypothetical protein [Candidatus Lokiarchaeota archaeon]